MGVEVLYGSSYVGKFEEWIKSSENQISHVLLSRPHISVNYLTILSRLRNIRVIYYGHDLHFDRLNNEYEVTGNANLKSEAEHFYKMESQIWSAVDVVLYPSDEESAKIKTLIPSVNARTVSPYIYSNAASYGERKIIQGEKIVFVAGFGHPPNIDAAIWFVNDIFPNILITNPNTMLFLIGSNPSEEIKALSSTNVIVTGYVTDDELLEHYLSARVAVVPLRYGAGIKNKVVEAMAFGVPLVTTEVGAQGMECLSEIIPVTSIPDQFAKAVEKLMNDDDLWIRVSLQGASFVEGRFSADAMKRTLANALDVVV
jgi:O-antigen biosynthesis protein